ncbi:uncharacterized protein LOC111054219 isoform X1 [Nilaparvata lugens]|uniref:uncharacterized protein LOC111054219 isoform X1 n=1 Tax=Nilaparvata lugens TaxID=108931 RepID=UPI00193D3957|nr:uncharacterized protein LOC111054219 isoform X1 [Nilaparvata lugens]
MAARESELQSQDDKNAEDEEKHSRRNSEAENLLNCGAVDIAVVGRKDTPNSRRILEDEKDVDVIPQSSKSMFELNHRGR